MSNWGINQEDEEIKRKQEIEHFKTPEGMEGIAIGGTSIAKGMSKRDMMEITSRMLLAMAHEGHTSFKLEAETPDGKQASLDVELTNFEDIF